jgi:hypothetical protein
MTRRVLVTGALDAAAVVVVARLLTRDGRAAAW